MWPQTGVAHEQQCLNYGGTLWCCNWNPDSSSIGVLSFQFSVCSLHHFHMASYHGLGALLSPMDKVCVAPHLPDPQEYLCSDMNVFCPFGIHFLTKGFSFSLRLKFVFFNAGLRLYLLIPDPSSHIHSKNTVSFPVLLLQSHLFFSVSLCVSSPLAAVCVSGGGLSGTVRSLSLLSHKAWLKCVLMFRAGVYACSFN